MQMNYNITVHLGTDDITAILTQHFLEKRGLIVGDLRYNIVTEICGIGPGEHECHNFKGVTFKCEQETPIPVTTSNDRLGGK